jgi:hypothetical protein
MAEADRLDEARQGEPGPQGDGTTAVVNLPPDEQFWEKYSRNFEFPLSTFGAIAAHILVVGLIILIWKWATDDRSNVSPPIRTMLVAGDGEAAGDGTIGSGSNQRENPMENPAEQVPAVPDAQFQEVQSLVLDWVPDLKSDPELVQALASSKELEKLRNMNENLRKKLLDGMTTKGKGKGTGEGDDPDEGSGKSGRGTGNTTGERSLRWQMQFNNIDLNNLGRSYLDQLASLNAKILIANPPSGATFNLYTDLKKPNPGELFTDSGVREMWFVESQPSYVQGVARALGSNYVPHEFIVIFPKAIEDKMAQLELAYNGKSPLVIESTTFQFNLRGGEPVITVKSQTIKRR